MNRIHRTVWSQHRGACVAVAETTRSQGKTSGVSGALLASVLLAGLSGAALADPASIKAASAAPLVLPSGGQVTAGQAKIDRSGNTLTVNQGSARTAIEWTNFSIGKEATVQFVQPDAGAVALNRVTGSEGSVIDGALKANGQVFILNPNGVLFGKNAKVDTAGLVATTLKLSDADLLAGKTTFGSGDATGVRGAGVVNQGSLNAKDGGYVVLMGNQVRNDGVISARLGTVALAAGNKVSLNFNGDSLVGVVVDVGALDALVANGNAIRADGGLVVLTAKGADSLVNTLVNNTGEIRAQTIENKAGRIYLLGEGGAVEVAGTLDASAPAGGAGGFIETSGPKVHIADGAAVSTRAAGGKSGQWLIDPVDFTIAASGGDITGTTLSNNLAAGSVTIQSTSGASGTSGDVNVKDTVSWSSNSTLTLNAVRNININAPIAATGANAKLALEYGQGAIASGNTADYVIARGATVSLHDGPNFSTRLGSDGSAVTYSVISSAAAVQAMGTGVAGRYALGADVDLATITSFTPIGNSNLAVGYFTGMFTGLGHAVSNLTVDSTANPNIYSSGLFGETSNATLRDVRMVNATVSDNKEYGTVGGFVGYAYLSRITNVDVSASTLTATPVFVSPSSNLAWNHKPYAGGLAGWLEDTVLTNSSANAVVVSTGASGGLVGTAYGTATSIRSSYSGGQVTASSIAGGLVGEYIAAGTTISDLYSTASVTLTQPTNVLGAAPAGGLIGRFGSGGGGTITINNAYATGPVSGPSGAALGGLLGNMYFSGPYAALNNLFFDTQTTGRSNAIGANAGGSVVGTGAQGLSTAAMTTTSTFTGAGWNFALGTGNGVWGRRDDLNGKYPVLRGFGYTDRIGVLTIDPAYLADPNAALSYTTSGLLSGDTMTLTQSGSTLSYAFSDPSRTGFYDAMLVRSQATTGDLTINHSFGWNNFKLTLEAAGDINVNGVLSATGTSTLDVRTGYNFNATAPAFDASKKLLVGFNADRTFAGRVDFDRTGNGILSVNNAGYTLINSLGVAGSTTSADLQGMAGNRAGRYALAANIDASATSGWNSGAGFTPVGNSDTSFQGTFDGLGHTVAGLAITGSADTGLFGGIGMGAALRNVALTGATVNAGQDAGVLVGRYLNPQASNASIDNVHVSGTVSATGEAIGGLIGNAYGQGTVGGMVRQHLGTLTVTNASAAVDVSTTTSTGTGAGGLVGIAKNATLSDSFATGNATALSAASVGGLAGSLEDSVVSGSHATGSAAGLLLVGGLVGEWNAKSAGSRVNLIENSYATGNATSTSTTYSYTGGLVGDLYHTAGSLTITGSHATGNVMAATAAGGLLGGSEDGVVSVIDSYATGNVTSTQDAAGGLIGTTAGGTISGSQASGVVNGYWKSGGLVGSMVNTAVSTSSASGNVTGNRVSGNGASGIGGLVGWMVDSSVSTSQASGTVTGYEVLGGLVGYAENTGASTTTALTNISATGNVTGSTSSTTGMVGGLVGQAVNSNPGYTVTISGAQASGVVYGSTAVGGLFGQMQDGDFAISGSNRVGNNAVTGTDNGVGGIVGYVKFVNTPSSLTLTGGNVASPVTGLSYVGGAVGGSFTGLTISQTATSGAVSGSSYIGGLVGDMGGSSDSISHASSSSPITATGAYVGGLIGFASGTVSASQASGDVVGGANVGGLIGRTDSSATVSASHATGAVTATGSAGVVGGLVGYNFATITESYATGDVLSTAVNAQGVGGLVGLNRGTVENAYARGDVSAAAGATGVGGLVGLNLGTINNTYSTGQVTAGAGSTDVGGLVGQENGNTTNSFWDVETSGLGTAGSTTGSAGGTGKSTADMNANALFTGAGWDFSFGTGVWGRKDTVNDKYPVLRTFGYTDPLTLTLASAGKSYGDANPALTGFTVIGCPVANCIAAVNLGSAIGLTTGVGSYAYNGSNMLSLTFAGGYSLGQFDLTLPTTSFSVTPRVLTVAAANGATRVYDATAQVSANLLAAANVVNGDTVTLAGSALLAARDVGNQAIGNTSALTQANPNYTLAGATTTGTVAITPATVGVAAVSGATRIYDRSTAADASLFQVSGLLGGDTAALSGSAVLAGINVGAQALAGAGTLALNNANYTLAAGAPAGTVAITPLAVAVSSYSTSAKVYDGNTDFAADRLRLSGVLGGDVVNLGGTATLGGSNVGHYTFGLSNGTLDNTNYTLVGTVPSGTVAVLPRLVSLSTVAGAAQVYDGGTAVAADLLALGDLLAGDSVHLGGTATLASRNVGNQSVRTGALTLDNPNYTLEEASISGRVAVTARPVTVAGVGSRVYDGSTSAAASLLQITNAVAGDSVALGGAATLASRNVGAQTFGPGSLTLSNGNYTLVGMTATGTVTITARPVTLATVDGASRVYDGSTTAAASLIQVGNLVAGDSVALGGTATLAGKAAGMQPIASSALTLANANYTLAGVMPTGTVAITPRTLNLTFTVASKVFDGSTAATVTASDDRVAGDTLSASASGAFADTTVGNAKAVAISGVSVTGADAGNYRVASSDAAHGNLLARSVTYTLAPQDPTKTYTASGQVLVSATDLDRLVAATFTNTVAGTAPGALSYTLWRNGEQVSGLKEAGTYEVRATFAAADAHYALADTGNTVLVLNVSPSQPNALQETIAQAVRTEVPDSATAAVYATTTAPRPLAEFNPAPPNVAAAPPSIINAFGAGTPLSIVSSPSEKEPSEGVSLTQARRMVTAANGQSADSGTREVRVPVSRNSLAEIVNGGVKLPGGVDQLLFVVKAGQ